jgi:hypothetical protein
MQGEIEIARGDSTTNSWGAVRTGIGGSLLALAATFAVAAFVRRSEATVVGSALRSRPRRPARVRDMRGHIGK